MGPQLRAYLYFFAEWANLLVERSKQAHRHKLCSLWSYSKKSRTLLIKGLVKMLTIVLWSAEFSGR